MAALLVALVLILAGPATAAAAATQAEEPPPAAPSSTVEIERRGRTVYLATGERFADALAASAVADSGDVVLLVRRDELPDETRAAIVGLRPRHVVVVGGADAVGDSVLAEVDELDLGDVERVGGADRYATAALLADRRTRPDTSLSADAQRLFGLAALVYVFIFTFLFKMLSRSQSRLTALAAAHAFRTRLATWTGPTSVAGASLGAEVNEVLSSLGEGSDHRVDQRVVLGAWRHLHAIEVASVPMWPEDVVRARYRSAVSELRRMPRAKEQVAAMEEAWRRRPQQPTELAALLGEGLEFHFDDRDDYFEGLSAWDQKARGLTIGGVVLAGLVAVAFGRESLILVGAVGGVVSRLVRVLRRRPQASDYGASWSVLALAPVLGGLAGWAGTLVLHLLSRSGAEVVGPVFGQGWTEPLAPVSLAVAFLLGFSERLLGQVASFAEARLAEPLQGEAAAEPAPTPERRDPDPAGTEGEVVTAPDETAALAGTASPSRSMVMLPDVVGIDAPRATAWLEALGFAVDREPAVPAPGTTPLP
ncbi:MAG: cell wall-binding repeat-containing protein, partial [Acidimicrobiales bacterium]